MKYNVYAVVQMGLRTAVALLLVRIFGVSPGIDAYFIAVSVLATLQAFEFLFVEQFMYFYSDAKKISVESASAFYSFSFSIALLVGALFALICLFGAKILSLFFASGLDAVRLSELRRILPLLAPMAFLAPAAYINDRILNAEEKFSFSYISAIFSLFLLLLFQLWMLRSGVKDAGMMAIGSSLEAVLAFMAGVFFCHRSGFLPKPVFKHSFGRAYIRNSFAMRAGHGIYGLAFGFVTNNALASLPGGAVSYFNYAQRIVSVAHTVVTGPPLRVLQSKVASAWSSGRILAVKEAVYEYARGSLLLFFGAAAAAWFAIPYILGLAGGRALTSVDISYIRIVFVCLAAWYAVVILEAAFVSVCVAAKDSRIFIVTNSFFSVFYWLAVSAFLPRFGVYALAMGAVAAQSVNLAAYVLKARKHMHARGVSS